MPEKPSCSQNDSIVEFVKIESFAKFENTKNLAFCYTTLKILTMALLLPVLQ